LHKNKLLKLVLILIFIIALTGCSSGSDWVMYRENLERTGSYNTSGQLPVGKLNWKAQLYQGQRVLSSPIVSQGMIFVNGPDVLYAVDANSGKNKWMFDQEKYAGRAPAIANGIVYAGKYGNTFFAVDTKNGQEKWKFEMGDMIASSPLISNDIVYIGDLDGYLYAFHSGTGQEKWKFKTKKLEHPLNSPTAAIDYEIPGGIASEVAISNGIVYMSSLDGYLYALEADTGNEKWESNFGTILSSPSVSNGTIYLGSNDGNVFAVDENGKLKWKIRIQDLTSVSLNPIDRISIDQDVTIANDVIYFTGSFTHYFNYDSQQSDCYLYAVESTTGHAIWKLHLSSCASTDLTVVNNVLYFGDESGIVHAIDTTKSKELWKFQADSAIYSEIAIANGKAYFSTDGNYLYALR